MLETPDTQMYTQERQVCYRHLTGASAVSGMSIKLQQIATFKYENLISSQHAWNVCLHIRHQLTKEAISFVQLITILKGRSMFSQSFTPSICTTHYGNRCYEGKIGGDVQRIQQP